MGECEQDDELLLPAVLPLLLDVDFFSLCSKNEKVSIVLKRFFI